MRCLSVYSSIFHILKNKSPLKPHSVHVEYDLDYSIHILQFVSVSFFLSSVRVKGIFEEKKNSTDYDTCESFVSVKIADNKLLFF